MARFDYRTQYKNMSTEELKKHMQYSKERYNRFFVSGNQEIANDYYRVYSYLKLRIEKLEKNMVSLTIDEAEIIR